MFEHAPPRAPQSSGVLGAEPQRPEADGRPLALTQTPEASMPLSLPRTEEWYVTVNGTYLVGFMGPGAHDFAVRQRQELSELLNGPAGRRTERDPHEHVCLKRVT
jgi:hypothetical protein